MQRDTKRCRERNSETERYKVRQRDTKRGRERGTKRQRDTK